MKRCHIVLVGLLATAELLIPVAAQAATFSGRLGATYTRASVPAGGAGKPVTSVAKTPAFCHQPGPIQADQITFPVSTTSCPITGRLVVLPDGAGLHIPAAGGRTVVRVLTTSGEEGLDARNINGQVRVISTLAGRQSLHGSSGQVSPQREARTSTAASDPACSEPDYLLLDPFAGTLKWYYNSSTAGRAGLSGSATLTRIRYGSVNITLDNNDCGFTAQFAAYGSYQGDTSKYANVNSSGQCTSRFPDGQNTDSWGPFYDVNYLAVTCLYATAGRIREADTYFGSNVGIVTSTGSNCSTANGYDLEDISTHEWGHAFGLDDLTSSADSALTMYIKTGTCETKKDTLGKGDHDGMANLYGFR